MWVNPGNKTICQMPRLRKSGKSTLAIKTRFLYGPRDKSTPKLPSVTYITAFVRKSQTALMWTVLYLPATNQAAADLKQKAGSVLARWTKSCLFSRIHQRPERWGSHTDVYTHCECVFIPAGVPPPPPPPPARLFLSGSGPGISCSSAAPPPPHHDWH